MSNMNYMLYVVFISDGGADGEYLSLSSLSYYMEKDWKRLPCFKVEDLEIFDNCKNAKPGDVINWRMGWIFITNRGE